MRCGAFDEGFYPATGDFAAEGDCESAAADFVDIVWLRVAGFAAAVDYVVELFAVSAVEYSGEVFYLSLGPCILAKGKRVESGKVEEKRRGRGGETNVHGQHQLVRIYPWNRPLRIQAPTKLIAGEPCRLVEVRRRGYSHECRGRGGGR